jgi:hypothetical protein
MLIRPGIAKKYLPFDIYHEPSKIKTSTGEKPIRFKAKTQAFPELNNDTSKIIESFMSNNFFLKQKNVCVVKPQE